MPHDARRRLFRSPPPPSVLAPCPHRRVRGWGVSCECHCGGWGGRPTRGFRNTFALPPFPTTRNGKGNRWRTGVVRPTPFTRFSSTAHRVGYPCLTMHKKDPKGGGGGGGRKRTTAQQKESPQKKNKEECDALVRGSPFSPVLPIRTKGEWEGCCLAISFSVFSPFDPPARLLFAPTGG